MLLLTPGCCNEYCVSLTLCERRSYRSTPLPPSVIPLTFFHALDTASTLPARAKASLFAKPCPATGVSSCHRLGGGPSPDIAVLYISSMLMHGTELETLRRHVQIHQCCGHVNPAWKSIALVTLYTCVPFFA